MEYLFDVNRQTFEEKVIKQSYNMPVVVDFWAPWCAPCRTLKPLLESIVSSMNGEVVLAKLNTEDEPELATDYGIRGIPNVKIFKDGEVVDEFTGVISEAEIRSMLQKHIQTEADLFLKNILTLELSAQAQELEKNFEKFNANLKYLFFYGKTLFLLKDYVKAFEVISLLPKLNEFEDEILNMKMIYELTQWDSKTPQDKYETYLVQAAQAFKEEHIEEALNFLTDLLFRKKDYLEGAVKKMTLALMHLIPEEEKRSSFSRKISMAINA